MDIDDLGIRTVSAARQRTFVAAWQAIADVRPERHGGRTHVAVYLDSGEVARLPAPYDGLLLVRDREFERKLFMLRHLWETHRTFARKHYQPPLDGM